MKAIGEFVTALGIIVFGAAADGKSDGGDDRTGWNRSDEELEVLRSDILAIQLCGDQLQDHVDPQTA